MPRIVPTASAAVNARLVWQRLGRDQLIIWALFGGVAAVGYITGLENWLAEVLYQPNIHTKIGAIAWALRQWGAALPGYVAVGCLLALFWPRLWHSKPLIYYACAVIAFSALLGTGLLNQVVLQEMADRHRPRETLLVGLQSAQLPAELTGNSMPSGHAGIAFCLAAPFFVWRQRRPRWAKAALVVGVVSGLGVGLGRMILGAHYLSDVLVAGAIALSSASLLALPVLRMRRPFPPLLLLAGCAVAAVSVVLGNHFRLTLNATLPTPFPPLNLPCVAVGTPTPPGGVAGVLTVQLTGYGAPVSGLQLAVRPEGVSLQRGWGAFHSLSCTASITLDKPE